MEEMEACVLHWYEDSTEFVIPVTQRRWTTIVEYAKRWQEVEDHQYNDLAAQVLQNIDYREGIVCHKRCVDRFCNKLVLCRAQKRKAADDDSQAPAKKTTRVSAGIPDGLVLPQICVICEQKDKWVMGKRDQLSKAGDGGKLRACASAKADHRILRLIGYTSDCVAREVHYHRRCFRNFTRDTYEKVTAETAKEKELYTKTYNDIFRPKIIDERLMKKNRIYKMTTLARIFSRQVRKHECADAENILSSMMKRRLQRDYPQLIIHSQSKKEGDIVFHKGVVCGDSGEESDDCTGTEDTIGSTSKQANTKYSSIRTQDVKAKNMVDAKTRSGAGSQEIKVLEFYDACMFLRDHVEVASQANSLHPSPTSDEEETSPELDEYLVSEVSTTPHHTTQHTTTTPQPVLVSTISRPGKRKSSEDVSSSILEQACGQLNLPSDNMTQRKKQSQPAEQDDCHIYAMHIAENLRQIKDPQNRALCKLKIEEVLFQSQFGPAQQPNPQPFIAQVPPQSYQPPLPAATSSFQPPIYHDMDIGF